MNIISVTELPSVQSCFFEIELETDEGLRGRFDVIIHAAVLGGVSGEMAILRIMCAPDLCRLLSTEDYQTLSRVMLLLDEGEDLTFPLTC